MSETSPLPPGLIIGAPRSGSGKTTVTLGLLRALKRRGHAVQPFKCGPDYIDPAFHVAAAGRESYNVDSWAMRWPRVAGLLSQASNGADIVIVEGLMGFYDGVVQPGHWGNGASSDLAAATGWPAILVLDVSGQSQTAAAVARGFMNFRDRVEIAGVILNRVGSARHTRFVSEALTAVGLPVVGALPREAKLVQAEETAELESRLETLADFIDANVDMARIVQLARSGSVDSVPAVTIRPPGQRIALARDAAFSFVYPHLLAAWREAGAEIITFSPLADEVPDATADVVWMPGGYPELHAGRLAAADRFKSAMRKFAETRPVHGECGGYMTLGTGLVDASGVRHEMIGLLGLETSFAKRKLNLGYRKAEIVEPCVLGKPGDQLTGHEFHYASVLSSPDAPLFHLRDSDGNILAQRGSRRGLTTGSFLHVVDV